MKIIFLFVLFFVLSTSLNTQGEHKNVKKYQNQSGQALILTDDISYSSQDIQKKNIPDQFQNLLDKNKVIVQQNTRADPNYYSKHADGQKPKYLWIGCSDSRVIPEQMIGAEIGEVFITRNVANQIVMGDNSAMAVLQYGIEYLGIDNIIIAGHYGCGGIKTTFTQTDYGNLESWLYQIRQIKLKYRNQLTGDQKIDEPRLVELNVKEQVHRLARTPFVEKAWKSGRNLKIFGVVYDVTTGKLIPTGDQILSIDDLDKGQGFYI